ncbi:hypothetical protein G7046_g620 [Stylonectria norvegica]|nr:hypothetical protein G7046_g620 [Stylonectria norvegica]
MPFSPVEPTGNYPIKGIPLKDGETPKIRQELREFRKDGDLWNLYLLGLWQFQKVPQEKLLSYFQIAGIHGLPYESWPKGDKKIESLKTEPVTGFCTHSSILFLSWHRPYLALFESTLRDAMLYVANQFTLEEDQEKHVKAAEGFRQPYWDWALLQTVETPVFPDEATKSDVVEVIMPESLRKFYNLTKNDDGSVKIRNPLYAYEFQSTTPENVKWDNLPTTTRYHLGGGPELTPEQQKDFLVKSLTPYTQDVGTLVDIEVNLRERVVYLLKSYEKFDQVSNNQWNQEPDGSGFGSIEDIHNTLHVLIGGPNERSGHMTDVARAAFDPIFWLHHANIDRLVSIWQDLREDPKNPNSWVTTKQGPGESEHSWVTAPDADEGLLTELAPFYKDIQGSFWVSDDVRDTKTFGYAYPETKSWNFENREDYRADIKHQLDTLYPFGAHSTMIVAHRAGDQKPEQELRTRAKKLVQIQAADAPNTALTALSIARAEPTAGLMSQAEGVSQSPLASVLLPIDIIEPELPAGRSLSFLAKDNTYLEWLLNIKAQKHALGGKYLVHAFLDNVPQGERTVLYPVSPHHVGTFAPLGQSSETGCGKCQRDQAAHTEITGQIPLTIALVERYFAGWLPSLEEADVIEYLQKNLHWEVVDEQGRRLQGQRNAVDGLLVGVVSNEVTLPSDGHEFPRYSPDIKIYPEITTKEDGSAGRGEGTGVTEDNKYFGLPTGNV